MQTLGTAGRLSEPPIRESLGSGTLGPLAGAVAVSAPARPRGAHAAPPDGCRPACPTAAAHPNLDRIFAALSSCGHVLSRRRPPCPYCERGGSNAVAPGRINTARSASLRTSDILEWRLSRIAMGRMGNTDEVAGAVVYLASDAASWTTGAIIDIDGGRNHW